MGKIEHLRAKDAAKKAAFYSGQSDNHPHGESGKRRIIPVESTSDCWDTAPHAFRFSEYGNQSGSV